MYFVGGVAARDMVEVRVKLSEDGEVLLPNSDEEAKAAHEGCLDNEQSNCIVYDKLSGDGTVPKDSALSVFEHHKERMSKKTDRKRGQGHFCKMTMECHQGGAPFATRGGYVKSCHANVLNYGSILSFVRKVAEVTAGDVKAKKYHELSQGRPDGKALMKEAAIEAFNSRHTMRNFYDDKVSSFSEIECV
jgi:hypothetical protein